MDISVLGYYLTVKKIFWIGKYSGKADRLLLLLFSLNDTYMRTGLVMLTSKTIKYI